tara:strand:- start:601 stop:3141 length:2541 start_codon:yes stop_codon:yes gene_type:complete
MALVADIQLQNASVVPEKIDTTKSYTFAGLTASTALAAGEGNPITTSGLTTFVTANNLQSWFTSTATNGDSSIILNNDSNQRWGLRLKGSENDNFTIDGGINSTITYMSIKKAGQFGFGTNNPSTTTIADFNGNNSASAALNITNTTDNTTIRLAAESTSGSIGTISNNNVGLRVNGNTVATVSSNGIDLEAGKLYTVNGQQVLGGAIETTKGWPNYISTTNDAYKITFHDVIDSKYVWDWEYAKKYTITTSWYDELGTFPRYAIVLINASQNSVSIIDRDDNVLTEYMNFSLGANNMVSGSNILDYSFLDFKLYISTDTNGVHIIDFLQDKAYRISTAGVDVYQGTISNRNAGSGWLNSSSIPTIANDNVISLSVARDPAGDEDDFIRPWHFWAAATGSGSDATSTGGLSIFNPETNDIYTDDIITPRKAKDVKILEDGKMWWIKDDDTDDILRYASSVRSILSDNFGSHNFSPSLTNGQQLVATTTDDLNSIDAYPQGSMNGSLAIFTFSQAKGIHFINNNETFPGQSAYNIITSTYSTPYMKGGRVGGWPLDNVTDKGGIGNDFTNNNTVTFSTSNAPHSNKAVFNGTNQYLSLSTSDFSMGTNSGLFSGWIRTSSATNPVSNQTILNAFDSVGTDNKFKLYYNTSGQLVGEVQNDTGAVSTITGPSDTYNAEWNYVVLQRNADDDNIELWLDGVLVGTAAFDDAGTNNTDTIYIGVDSGTTEYFAGEISNVTMSNDVFLTRKEIVSEYNRGRVSISQNTTKIASDTIGSINVDVDSAYAISVINNTATIIDVTKGLVYSSDAVTSGTLNDVDVKTMTGSYTPHYLLGGSLSIEQVAPNTIID